MGQRAEIIWAVELGNAELLLKLKSKGEFGVWKRIPKEWEEDSLDVEEGRAVLEEESVTGLVPEGERAADSDLEAVEQGHRHSVTNGGAEAARFGGW